MLQRHPSSAVSASPHGNRAPSSPPRDAYSHSRLGGQPPAGPRRVRGGVVPADVDDRVVPQAVEVGSRAPGVAPVGPLHPDPPRRPRGRAHQLVRRSGQAQAEDGGEAEGLGLGDVARCDHEPLEVVVRDGRRVDAERREVHGVHRALAVAAVAVAGRVPHRERPSGQLGLGNAVPPGGDCGRGRGCGQRRDRGRHVVVVSSRRAAGTVTGHRAELTRRRYAPSARSAQGPSAALRSGQRTLAPRRSGGSPPCRRRPAPGRQGRRRQPAVQAGEQGPCRSPWPRRRRSRDP